MMRQSVAAAQSKFGTPLAERYAAKQSLAYLC